MSMWTYVKAEEGFTIQELLVAIVAGSLLVGFSFSLYLFVARIVQKDIREREHRENALRAIALVASDIERSSYVVALSDSTLELESARQRKVVYTMSQGELLRSGVAVGPGEGEQWMLRFRSPAPGRTALELKSIWGKDSLEVRTEVSVPLSSAVAFRTARGEMGPYAKEIK